MKIRKTFLIILYLIISTSILSVESRIQFAKSMNRYSALFKRGGENTKDPQGGKKKENINDEDEKPEEKKASKVMFFLLGMFARIPYIKYAVKPLKALMTEKDPPKPDCKKEDFLEIYKKASFNVDEKKPELDQETQEFLDKIGQEVGKDQKDLQKIDWDNPKSDCEKIVKIYEKEREENENSQKVSTKYLEFVQKVRRNNETFEEFQKISKKFKLFHLQRIELKNYIIAVLHDGKEKAMIKAYSDNQEKWQEDLELLEKTFEENGFSADYHRTILEEHKNSLPDCKNKSSMKSWDVLKKNMTKLKFALLGAVAMLEHALKKCVDVKKILSNAIGKMTAKFILSLIALIFGGIVFKIIQMAISVFKIGYLFNQANDIKGVSKKDKEKKYDLYGQSMGVFIAMLLNILLIS